MMVKKEDIVMNLMIIMNISSDPNDHYILNKELKDLGVDSLKLISVIIEVEELYHIDFKPQDLSFEKMRSIASIADCILSYIN